MITRGNLILVALLVLQGAILGLQAINRENPAEKARSQGLLLEDFDVDAVQKVRIEGGGEDTANLTLEKTESGWRVPAASNYPADSSKVTQTLRDIAGLEIADVVSTTDHHHRDLKVEDANFEKRVVLEGSEGETALLFGTPGRAGSVHVRKGTESTVFAVRDFSSWRLSSEADTWVDRTYFTFNKDQVSQVTLQNAEGRLELQKGADGWLLQTETESRAVETGDVDAFLNRVQSIQLTKVGERIEDPTQALPGAVATLTVKLGDGTQQTLEVAPVAGEKGQFDLQRSGSAFRVRATQFAVQAALETKADGFPAKAAPPEEADKAAGENAPTP